MHPIRSLVAQRFEMLDLGVEVDRLLVERHSECGHLNPKRGILVEDLFAKLPFEILAAEKAERGQAVYRILPVHTDKSLTFHKRIVRLIVARRFDALGAAMEEHNRHVLKAMERLLGAGMLEDDLSSASSA
jgi:hypothetical protein